MKHWTALLIFMYCIGMLFIGSHAVRSEEIQKKTPVAVKADTLDYDRTRDRYVAVGHVRIEQSDMLVEADAVTLDNISGEAVAEGHVYLRDKGNVVTAEKLLININTRAGVIYKGDLFMAKDNYHLRGEKIEKRSDTVYHVEMGTFTTCNAGEWYLKADAIDVDMDRYATGTGVSFNMIGLPVFYTPYLLFPVRRQTGLLIPEVGYNSTEGFLMKNSFFWALSDYRDMTLYSDYRSLHGVGTGAEYRYVNSRDSSGKTYFNYFDTIPSGEKRWELMVQHQEEFAEDLSGRVDINLVSDHGYYRDLEKKLELRSRTYLDSNAFYVERWNTAALFLTGQYSTDLTRANERTIQKMPEVRYIVFEETITGPLHLNFDGSAANFEIQQGTSVRRADFNPQLLAAFGGNGLSFTPRVGARTTFYSRSLETAEPTERKYYYAGADLNARVSRQFGTDREEGIGRIRHSIEPSVSYSYIPRSAQKSLYQLDATDAVFAQNLVTAALTNRLTAHYREGAGYSTYDMMVFRISQSYDLIEAQKTDVATAHPRSEIRSELFVKTPKALTVSAGGTYDTYTDSLTTSSEGIMLHVNELQFDLTHQYLRAPRTQFLTGGAGFKLGQWDLNVRLWRDVENRKTTQQDFKAHYSAQCWGINLAYTAKPGESQFLAMLDLKGLGGVKL